MRHQFACPLRWSDMDAFGHVNNVVFLRYLEEARIDFMFRAAREVDSSAFGGGAVVARHEIDYLRPLVHRHEPVAIETWVTKLTAASATVAYEIRDGSSESPEPAAAGSGAGGLYVRATTVIVPYDLERGRPRRMTAGERAFLEGYVDDSHCG
ncbi:acyl-CoA thioesterase [Streptomyces sp. AJS327]|uniref:acyl-CoA thioesterase n=1 Tax=Streptomyces sp. AJS327 TaxID=2545265 RepID=UPI0015DF47C3|nr:thioesterase family protein [Streptomyces sp. AJS327]MBA0049794.1 acyl-CoA thioesterase [Streptomyces sp. AJS327]